MTNRRAALVRENLRIFGIKPRQFQHHTATIEYRPSGRPGFRRAGRQRGDQGKGAIRYQPSDRAPGRFGARCHEQGRVFLGEDGQPVRMVGTVHDIIRRDRERREMQKLAMALEQASDWIWSRTWKAGLNYVNKAVVTTMSGLRKKKIWGKTPAIFNLGETRQRFLPGPMETIRPVIRIRPLLQTSGKTGDCSKYTTASPL